jgi:hypothetical protein
MRAVWISLAAALLVCGFLGYRTIRLEQRVDALGRQLGAPNAGGAAGAAASGKAQTSGDHEQRLRSLEQEARALRDDLQTLEEATGERTTAAVDPSGSDQRILSVVTREQERIRDRQLEFHRARWLEWREGALDNFAQTNRLSPVQTDQLHRLLADEVDALVQLLRRPDVAENPERAANDWLDRLELTDRAAHNILAEPQISAWDQARTVERRVFWPWLPEP